ncbi:IS66 family transposase [Bdellovibrionota bacterium FG-2]
MNLNFLDTESRPDILREFAKISVVENLRLIKEISELKKAQVKSLEQVKLGYLDTLTKLQTKLFSHGTETLTKNFRPKRNEDLLAHGDLLNPSDEPTADKKAKDRDIAADISLYAMGAAELKDEAMTRGNKNSKTSDWKEMPGLYDEATEITVIERVYKKTIHRRKKYLFLPSVGTDKEVIVTAKGPSKLLPGCEYSVDFAIAVTCDKFQHHTPLNRQVEQMVQKGLYGITSKTLYGLTDALSSHARRAQVMEKIRQDIFSVPLAVHADETPWPILNDHDSDGYLWTICNMAGAYYRFEPSRSGKIIVEMLKGYSGPVVSDEFSGYNRVKNETKCVLCYCWAHARRNFYDILKTYPEDCAEILLLIDELFAVEREAGRSFDKLKILRAEKSQVLADMIKAWLEKKEAKYLLSENEMTKAIGYLLGHWKEFTVFLSDIRVPLSNNHAERALRHGVLGRKNFNGSKTINGADVAADHYTVIETCKLVALDPAVYYRYLVDTNNAGGEVLSPLGYVRWLWEQKKAARAKAAAEQGAAA